MFKITLVPFGKINTPIWKMKKKILIIFFLNFFTGILYANVENKLLQSW